LVIGYGPDQHGAFEVEQDILIKLEGDSNAAWSGKFASDCSFACRIRSNLTTCGEKAADKSARIFARPAERGMLDLGQLTLQNDVSNQMTQRAKPEQHRHEGVGRWPVMHGKSARESEFW
jgi:hypothetical protein